MFGFRTRSNDSNQATLYAIVFGSAYVKMGVLFLFGFMLLQPVAQAYAAEDSNVSEPATETEVASKPAADPEPEVSEATESNSSDPAEEESSATDDQADEEVVTEEGDNEYAVLSSEETEEVTDGSEDATEEEVIDPELSDDVTETSSDETQDDEQATTSSTVSEDTSDETVEVGDTSASTSEDVSVPAEDSDSATSSDSGVSQSSGSANNTNTDTNEDNSSQLDDNQDPATTTADSVATTTEQVEDHSTTTSSMTEEEARAELDRMIRENLEQIQAENESAEEEQVDDQLANDEAASTSIEVAEPVPVEAQAYVLNDDNRHQFSETECVSVGEGSYYCSNEQTEGMSTSEPVYASVDETGDYEIFFHSETDTIQITDNSTDDRSPYYDAATEQIVWHQLNGGRYQIMRYDLNSKGVEVVSDASVNNMEPVQADGLVVWQRWVDNNWEIAMRSGGEMQLITNNDYHDVAPSVKGDYIIWHTTSETGDKLLAVYEISTGLISTIADPDGGHVENPRFVLVYDTTYENGDRVTKQYDPVTGEIVSVDSEPTAPPPPLPDPEPAGETSALLQNKSPNSKEDGDGLIDLDTNNGSTTSDNLAADGSLETASSTSPEVTDEVNDMVVSGTTSTTSDNLPLTEFDLIVEPFSASSSAQDGDSASTSDSVE